jgi:hypothetical protein
VVLQQGEQGGFACAVLAYNAYPLARVDDEFRSIEQHFGAATYG